MAKIRGFKPDLWTDDDFVEVQPIARLLWMGMWNFACDNGHLADKPKQIKMRVLPTDDANVTELLRELEGQGLIRRGDGWVTVPNLTRHQKVDRRYFTTCEKPGCDTPSETVSQRESRRAPAVHTSDARRVPTSALGDGDGEVKGSDGDRAPRKRGCRIPEGFTITEENREWAATNGFNLNLEAITAEFVDYWTGVPGQKGVKLDWEGTWRNWIRRKAEDAPRRGATAPRDQWARAVRVGGEA